MDLGVSLTVFALILPAELPDKTFVATLVLSTRLRPLPVLLGVSVGFLVQSAIAAAAGGVVSLLPVTLVHAVSAAVFAIGAVLMLRGAGDDDSDAQSDEVASGLSEAPEPPSPLRMAVTSFLVLFAAEWGDLSQLLTASLSAKYHDPVAVFVGASVALIAVAGLAVVGGRALLRVMPLAWVRRVAGVAFAVVAVVTALEAASVL